MAGRDPAKKAAARPAARSSARAKAAPSPTDGRELRTQGKKTMAKLLDAGMTVLGERGYHAARVDDVVRVADVSHGTFYLYFSNKEDLFRALAMQCADDMTALASSLGAVAASADGIDELRRWLAEFIDAYRRYGVVIRAWMEDQVGSRDLSRLGAKTFGAIAASLVARLRETRRMDDHEAELHAAAMLAMIERFTYFTTSRDLPFADADVVDTLATIIHRGFFADAEAGSSSRLKLARG
jgi:AcrR family transcriptional regulator